MKLDTSEAQIPVLEVGQTVQTDLFLWCLTDNSFFLKQTEGLWQPCVEQVSECHFFNNTCSLCVSGSQLVHSCGISNL